MLRIATALAILLLAACSSDAFNQPGHVPNYRMPLVNAPDSRGYQPPNSIPR